MRAASWFRQRHDRLGEHERFVWTAAAVHIELIDRLAAARHVTSTRREPHRLHRLGAIDSQAVRDRRGLENATCDFGERVTHVGAAVGWEKKDDAAASARSANFSAPRAGFRRGLD